MTDDLSTLRPEVADAVSALDETTCMTNPGLKWYATIRAELLRLADYEQAAGRLAIEKAEFRQRAEKAEAELAEAQNTIAAQQGTMGALKRKLALSEGELAALKARRDGSRHAFLGPNMDRITFLAEDIGPVGEYALVKVED